MQTDKSILNAIGNVSLVKLRKIVPAGCVEIFVKLEWENPTVSIKDRTAQATSKMAKEEGKLKPGNSKVELHL